MSHCRQQAFIDAPPRVVWDLLSDVNRHPEWWAGFVEVECDGLETGCEYRTVVKDPFGRDTEAQGGTFVDGEAGMEAAPSMKHRVWDTVTGNRWYRAWLTKSLDALGELAKGERTKA